MQGKSTSKSRQGLKRLVCLEECGCGPYMTVSQLERFGCPTCACGGRLVPDDPELAWLICPELMGEHRWALRIAQRESEALHGQSGSGRALGANMKRAAEGRRLRSSFEVAMEGTSSRKGVRAEMRDEARSRQLRGLRQFKPATDMPF